MKRAAIVLALIVILIAGAAFSAGPGTLSVLDGVMGGGRGTARVRGPWAPLGYAMLKRPIASARQYLGF